MACHYNIWSCLRVAYWAPLPVHRMSRNNVERDICVREAPKDNVWLSPLRGSTWCAAVTVSVEHVFGDAPLFTLCLPVAQMRHDRSHRKLMNLTEGPKSRKGRGWWGGLGRQQSTGDTDCNAHVTTAWGAEGRWGKEWTCVDRGRERVRSGKRKKILWK